MDYYKKSLELHEEHKGKLAIVSKVPLKTREDLSLSYTPGVAEPCKRIHKNPKDVYKYTNKGNMVAVISDGSAVLGLGNIGATASLPVMEGKAILFKEFGDVDAFPICLDTQDTEEIIKTVKLIAPSFGGINLEDISAPRCFEIEQRLINELDIPVFHDDQHGTAIVILAGMINALKITNKKLSDIKITLNGLGAAGTAVIKLLIKYGANSENILLCDSKGVIYKGRNNLSKIKNELAEITNTACHLGINNPECRTGGLVEAIKGADIFIGLSKPGLLTPDMVKSMSSEPIIFAMANPEPEIMPDLAKRAGAKIVATGRSDFPNQINNVLAFPGIFRGIFDAKITKITDDIKIIVAETIANYVVSPTCENLMPDILDRNVSKKIAEAIIQQNK